MRNRRLIRFTPLPGANSQNIILAQHVATSPVSPSPLSAALDWLQGTLRSKNL